MRIEGLSKSATSLKPEIVTARALAPLPQLLELAAPWLGSGARGLFLKGRDVGKEIEFAKRRFNFTCHLHPSMTADDSFILEISDLAKRTKAKAR
jgi:16S rRNA (guanine527-N7)-methyltransferase